MINHCLKGILLLVCLLMQPALAQTELLYVDPSADGANDGSDWENAYTDLLPALGAAEADTWILVAAGVYRPTGNPNNLAASFHLIDGVAIFGGFPPGGGSWSERDWQTHVSVLSGDIDNASTANADGVIEHHTDQAGLNSYNVVTTSTAGQDSILDGFHITGGRADGSDQTHRRGGGIRNLGGSPQLRNLRIIGNYALWDGGGVHNRAGAAPQMSNIQFVSNFGSRGGGLANYNANPVLDRIEFRGNEADERGGGLFNLDSDAVVATSLAFIGNRSPIGGAGLANSNSSLELTNASFSGNWNDTGAGAIHNIDGELVLRNAVLWNNQSGASTTDSAASIVSTNSQTTVYDSLVQNCGPSTDWNDDCGSDGGSNLTATDPQFNSTPNPANAPSIAGDLRLQAGSPLIDAGRNAWVSSLALADLGNLQRIQNARVDIGAHERANSNPDFLCPSGGVVYVDRSAEGANDGSSWDDAFVDLQSALTALSEACDVHVAAGTYPTTGSLNQNIRFQPRAAVNLYGGFPPGGGNLAERDWETHKSVLSGDLDGLAVTSTAGLITHWQDQRGHHAASIIAYPPLGSEVELDGFHITGGNADEYADTNLGGGILDQTEALKLQNLVVSGNRAHAGGGAFHFSESGPVLDNVSFIGNWAEQGGGQFNLGASPILIDVVFHGNHSLFTGAGMFNTGQSAPVLHNVHFIENSTESSAPAMANWGQSSPTMIGGSFVDNLADGQVGAVLHIDDSGGTYIDVVFDSNIGHVYAGALLLSESTVSLDGVSFLNNEVIGGHGGAITLDKAQIEIRNTLFSHNRAYGSNGGAIHAIDSDLNILGSVFESNQSNSFGGAIEARSGSTLMLDRSSFFGNQSNEGGAISVIDSSVAQLTNLELAGNSAAYGGAIHGRQSQFDITNASFSGNRCTAGSCGGAMDFINSSVVSIKNSVSWNNQAAGSIGNAASSIYLGGAQSSIYDSMLQGCNPDGQWSASCGTDMGMNLSDIDPLFLDSPDPADAPQPVANLRLEPASPAIGAGNNAWALQIPHDRDGNGRIQNARVDLGAFEHLTDGPAYACNGQVHYVDANAQGRSTGLSWTDAFVDLQIILQGASDDCEVHVAAGVYRPTVITDDLEASFVIPDSLRLYGGFPPGGGDWSERDWDLHITVLSGDIDGQSTTDRHGLVQHWSDQSGLNAYRVVVTSGSGPDTVLDGFHISGGSASGPNLIQRRGAGLLNIDGSPSLRNLTLIGNRSTGDGGGMHHRDGAEPELSNIRFINNRGSRGGGLANRNSQPTMDRLLFLGNDSDLRGGGLFNLDSSGIGISNSAFLGNSTELFGAGVSNLNSQLEFVNVSLAGNRVIDDGGGAIDNENSSVSIQNSIAWRNERAGVIESPQSSILNFLSTSTIANSLLQGCKPGGNWNSSDCGSDAGNNLTDADPQFVHVPDPAEAPFDTGSLRIAGSDSPVIDSGDASVNPSAADLDGNLRTVGMEIDLGAYERPSGSCPGGVRYVDRSATAAGDGESWASAFRELRTALVLSEACTLQVAAGRYRPTADTGDRNARFELNDDVSLLGGFPLGGGDSEDRDWLRHITVLSGDIDGQSVTDASGIIAHAGDLSGSNSYQVLVSNGSGPETLLDGFHITGGLADGETTSQRSGAGMLLQNSQIQLGNLMFSANQAAEHGGAMFLHSGVDAEWSNLVFAGNHALGRGGAIFSDSASNQVSIANGLFQGNRAESDGGAVAFNIGSLNLLNSSLSGNASGASGGALFIGEQAQLTVANSIVHFNQDQDGSATVGASISSQNLDVQPEFRHSLIEHCNPGGSWNTQCGLDNGGILNDADPRFQQLHDPATAPSQAGNLRLQGSSPALHAGDSSLVIGLDHDLDGNPRVTGPAVDLGPFELIDRLFTDRFAN